MLTIRKENFRDDEINVILDGLVPENHLVRKIENPEITGVLIVCDGGDDIGVKEKVINAVSTVLNIPSNRVYVTNSSKERLQ